jgi:hypothetical protein
MARIFTTPAGEAAAKAWMHDVMAIAGVLPQSQRTANYIYFTRYTNVPTAHASKICDELINRDFENIDASISVLSGYRFFPDFTQDDRSKLYKETDIAKAIVYMAECFGLYWDDTIRTPYEIDEFKNTILGKAVYTYGRYISAIKDKTTKTRASSTSSSGTSGTVAAAPQNNYKQSGPQSGNVRGLLGNPGDKVYADTSTSYRIEGDKVKSNTPRVFIKPLTASGAAGNSNKVYISSGNGYTDCTCYFDDPNEAQKFLDKILKDLPQLIKEKRAISDITNLHVAKVKSDNNGYFLVDTEYGPCAVSAKTLNEAMTEALEEEVAQPNGWEKATERYTKEELDELHTWMRRD